MIYTDQIGKFPIRSSRGHQYIMILVKADSGAILVVSMKSRKAEEMVETYQGLVDRLKTYGVTPNQHVLDNKCSTLMKQSIQSNGMTFQLANSHDHQHNLTEKAF